MRTVKSMTRRVNRPRLTKRVKPFARKATDFNKNLLTFVAVLRTLPSDQLYVGMILEQVSILRDGIHQANSSRTRMAKALPELRRMLRLNEFEDWTRER